MTKPVGQDANATNVPPAEAAGDDPFGLSPWLKEMPDVPLHPLMAHPMAAMAATTAIGFGIAGQMAGAMLGAGFSIPQVFGATALLNILVVGHVF